MKKLKKFFKGDLFAKHSGIELKSVSPGKAVARMKIRKEHWNGLGSVQGGAIFTLADFAFAAAANAHGQVAVAINVSISFLKAVTSGVLTAEAEEVSLGPKLASYTVRVTDNKKQLIALFQGMVYRKSMTLDALVRR